MQNNTTALAVLNKKEAEIIRSVQHDFESVPNLKLDFQREYGYALQAISLNSTLADTSRKAPESLQMAIYNVATTGLSLNPVLGYAYLVPRASRVILELGYKGMIYLMANTGYVRSVKADVVREKDEFQFSQGTQPFLHHVPAMLSDNERGAVICAYAVASLVGGGEHFEVMHISEIEKIASGSKSGVWNSNRPEMIKKTVIRRLFKYIPKPDLPENVLAAFRLHDENNPMPTTEEKPPRLIPVSGERDALLSDWSEKIKAIETAEDFNPMFRAVRELPDNLKAAVSEKVKARARELGLNYSKENDEFFFAAASVQQVEDFEEMAESEAGQ
jgi:recombination protein RecT